MDGTTVHNAKQLTQWFSKINYDLVALDTEVSSLRYSEMELAGVSLCDGAHSVYVDCLNGDEYDSLLEVLRTEIPKIKQLIMHNAPFDMKVLYKYKISHTLKVVCTMVSSFLLDENNGVGLKELAVRYLGVQKSDVLPFEKAVVQGFKSEMFYSYARRDAEWTWELWRLLGPRLEEESLSSLFFDIEMPFQFVLRDLEINGVLIDRAALSTLRSGLDEEIIRLQLETYKAGGVQYSKQTDLWGAVTYTGELNLNSPKDLSEFIQHKLGLTLTEQSDTGHWSVDKHVLEGLSAKHEFCRYLLEYRCAIKLKTMFLDKAPLFVDSDGRIRASFNNCVARTGRLSSSNPNLQQLPKKGTSCGSIRSLIIAKPGYKLLALDYVGQELRILAEVSRDLTMIEAFILGKDLHLTMANSFFQLGIPESLLYTQHPKYAETAKKYKEFRDKSKIINFGIAYGKTATGFAKDWNIPIEEAEGIVEAYFAAAPRVRGAIEYCKGKLDADGYVCNLAGRRRRLITENNHSYRQAFNFLIQGFCADLVKKAAVNTRSIIDDHPEWDCRIIMQVHDELIFELKEEYVSTVAPQIQSIMEHAWPNLCIPMAVSMSSGNNYSEV